MTQSEDTKTGSKTGTKKKRRRRRSSRSRGAAPQQQESSNAGEETPSEKKPARRSRRGKKKQAPAEASKPDAKPTQSGTSRRGRKKQAAAEATKPDAKPTQSGTSRRGRKKQAPAEASKPDAKPTRSEGSRRGRKKQAPAEATKPDAKSTRSEGSRRGKKKQAPAEASKPAAKSTRSEGSRRGKKKRPAEVSSKAESKRVRGAYIGHPRGFGFLVPEDGGADLLVPPRREGDAFDGDRVEAERGDRGTARIIQVLERGRKLMIGTYLGSGKFTSDAHRVPQQVRVTGKAEKGDKVLIAVGKTKHRIRRVLGRTGDPKVEDAAVLAELEIAPRFPNNAMAQTRTMDQPGGTDFRGRLDLRKATTVVTIDPVTSRDFDDAISLERQGDDWLLGVHIADVSHYVQADTPLDVEAYRRGTSVYLPGRVIPMLPEKLSNDLCSLREGIDRLAMSVLMRYSPDGTLRETTFAETVIRSDRRFSYERASRVMDRAVREKGEVGKLLLDMAKLARILAKSRPSFDLPRSEVELVYGGQGEVVELRPIAQDVAHGVIEEFMLAANREVARLMLRKRVPAIYRHHPAPLDLTNVWDDLQRLGVRRPKTMGLRKGMAAAVAKGYGPAAMSAVLRSMPRAIYTTRDSTHFSLGFEAYTHFTSPIRRYSDLVVHRRLREMLQSNRGRLKVKPIARLPQPVDDDALEAVAGHATDRAISADRAESRIRRRRVLEYLAGQKPTTLEGQVTLVVERGLTVDLPQYATWGFMPTDKLPGGPYRYEPRELLGKKDAYRLGDTVSVRIRRIDAAANELELEPAP